MSGGLDVIRRIMPEESAPELAECVKDTCIRRYQRTLGIETLRLIGLSREAVVNWLRKAGAQEKLTKAIEPIVVSAKKLLCYDVAWPADEWHWKLAKVWAADTPTLLRPLREIAESVADRDEPVRARATFRLRSRPALNYDALRSKVAEQFNDCVPDVDHRGRFAKFVAETVVTNRRDAPLEYRTGIPVGFAASLHQTFSFVSIDGEMFASVEFDRHGNAMQHPRFTRVVSLTPDELALDDGSSWPLSATARW